MLGFTAKRCRRSSFAGPLLGSVIALFIGLALAAAAPVAASAAGIDARYPIVRRYFPNATAFGPIAGTPPAAAAYAGNKVIGYAFESKMVAPVPGFSGFPIDMLIAIDPQGRILGVKVLEQYEPILFEPDEAKELYRFVAHYLGRRATDTIVVGTNAGKSGIRLDAISGATVSSIATNQTIMDAALKIALSRKIVTASAVEGVGGAANLRMKYYEKADWNRLVANGALRHLHLTRGDIAKAFKGAPPPFRSGESPAAGEADETFVDLYYGLVTPPSVGENLLGASAYWRLLKRLRPGDGAVAILANGTYSFTGVNYVRDGVFDRIHLVQGRKLIEFRGSDYEPLGEVRLSSMPGFREAAIFIVRKASGLDPGRPWTFELVVRRQIGPLKSVYRTFNGAYKVPSAYLQRQKLPVSNAPSPLWVRVWYAAGMDIAVLLAGLLFLTGILYFQDFFSRRPRLLRRVRIGFLIYTVGFIGLYAQGQLSVVNIFTLANAVVHGSGWSAFVLNPMICILWVFVAAAVLAIGRGAFCGWLCPFGALQELISKAAHRLRVPQFEVPWNVHKRAAALKYLILLFLVGLSLHSIYLAERFAEVEPFDTAIQLHFVRSWPFVLYAGLLLLVAAFNHKFYCKYVCPLGAGLAVYGRYPLLERLRQRPQCGNPCKLCAKECEVGAIDPRGRIDMKECHYCLDCQVNYWDEARCPPLAQRRKRLSPAFAVAMPQRSAARQNRGMAVAARERTLKPENARMAGDRDVAPGTRA